MSTDDPFAQVSVPAISFKDAPIGTSITGTVTEAPTMVQSRDYETGEPAFWPANPGQTPNPKMSAVFRIATGDGEERSVWAAKPSALFGAIADATSKKGRPLQVGDTVTITYTGDKKNDNPRLNPAKQYAVTVKPADAFGGDTTEAAPAPAAEPEATPNEDALAAAMAKLTPEQRKKLLGVG